MRRQLVMLFGSMALVTVLFLVPPGMLTRLPFFLFAPAALVAGFVAGNAHNISGPVYFVALTLEVWVVANGVYWAGAMIATRGRSN